MISKIKDKFRLEKKTTKKISHFVDKHQIVMRGFQLGCLVNLGFIYDCLREKTILMKMKNFVKEKDLEYDMAYKKQNQMIRNNFKKEFEDSAL